jgi:hypothetical protein
MARCLRVGVVGAALLAAAGAILIGQAYLVLVLTLPLVLAVTFVGRVASAFRREIVLDFFRRPASRDNRKYLAQAALRLATYGLWVAWLTLSVPAVMLGPDELQAAMLIFAWGPAVLLTVLALFPARYVSWSVNLLHGAGAAWLALQAVQVFVLSTGSSAVAIDPPFRGEWLVFQGGRSSILNHHYPLVSQRHALDLIRVDGAARLLGPAERVESYYSFDQPLFAPAAGRVERVVHDQPDQPIGGSDASAPVGNHVVIHMGNDRFILLAHLKKGSIVVREGEEVAAGVLLGHCGNSGNTSEPHLHLQIQNGAEFFADDLQTYPIRFKNATHLRSRGQYAEQNGELRRNDRVRAMLP